MRSIILGVSIFLLLPASAWADAIDPWTIPALSCGADGASAAFSRSLSLSPVPFQQPDAQQPVHAAAIEHSDAYQRRAKIHKYASFATLPLFATELALGESLYNPSGDQGGKASVHALVGAGIVGLFAVNTVTGSWNLFGEGWRDKQGRTLRLVHGLLMMVADAGFVATMETGPKSTGRGAATFDVDRVTHRNLAIASISVGTAGYLLMLLGNR